MDPITIGGIVILIAGSVAAAVKHYQNTMAKKTEELEKLAKTLQQYAETYEFEPCDQPVIESVRQYLRTVLSKGKLADTLANTDVDGRKKFFLKLVNEIAQRMNIELSEINILDLGYYTAGQAYMSDGRYIIELNEMLLVADPDRLLQTVAHELRHLQQIQAIKNDKWGYSNQRKAQWMIAFTNYVDWSNKESKMEYMAYVMQSIEIDANKFAEEVLNV